MCRDLNVYIQAFIHVCMNASYAAHAHGYMHALAAYLLLFGDVMFLL